MGRRSPSAQLHAMRLRYPQFESEKLPNGTIRWVGVIQPILQPYRIGVLWNLNMKIPQVVVLNPALKPRHGGKFEDVPHLLFDDENPEFSGLCLFDPDKEEWTNEDLIADTTIPWACEWLMYYELWHLDGTWRGKSVGYESVGEIRRLLGESSDKESEKCLQLEERIQVSREE